MSMQPPKGEPVEMSVYEARRVLQRRSIDLKQKEIEKDGSYEISLLTHDPAGDQLPYAVVVLFPDGTWKWRD